MFEALLQRWNAAWVRIIERLPPSDHTITAELPPEAFGVKSVQAGPPKSTLPPLASGQRGSR